MEAYSPSSSRTKSNSRISPNYFQRSISPSGRFCSSSISSSNSMSSSPQSSSGFLTRPTSHSRVNNKDWSSIRGQKTCMCSPTTHPGSFRCSLHKNVPCSQRRRQHETVSYHSHRLDARRSAMTNSLVRIGTVEGDLVKRALAALIRPSSHQQKRRADFHPRPTRLSIMSKDSKTQDV